MMRMSLLALGCFGLLPLIACIVVLVLFATWLRAKTDRDELVLSLLGEIRQTLDEIDDAMGGQIPTSQHDETKV